MKKNRTKRTVAKGRFASRRSASLSQTTLPGVLLDAKVALRELVLSTGLQVFTQMLEEDRAALCGPRSRPDGARTAYRHGHDEGRLVFGGRKIRLHKPRVRSVEGQELELPTWRRMAAEDPLQERVLKQLLLGVSTRGYEPSLEPLPAEVPGVSVKRASVSRHFVARTSQQMKVFLSRPLTDLDLPVILIDGRGVDDHLVLVALGIDRDGRKHVLGVVEGSTESEQVCRTLFSELIERGLVVERARLFVIDGGKGIRKAIRNAFAGWALIQRCQVHKLRNVMEHLPERRRAWVKAAMRRAWNSGTVAQAKHRLEDLASQLDSDHPSAAGSIREGLDETLTLIRLGVAGALQRTLCSTNPIENLQGTIARVTRNVKRWRGGRMVLRWVVTALIDAEKNFRRVRGHREMPQLIAALEALIAPNVLDRQEKIA